MIVRTAGGATYHFDRDAMTVLRVPGGSVDLRRDGEVLHLLAWPKPVVGEPLDLLLRVREDGRPTLRMTTLVAEVR